MQKTFSKAAVNIAELKKNPSRVLADAAGASVALLDQNHVVAYLVPAGLYEQILERLDDFDLAALAKARAAEKSIQVSLEDLSRCFGLDWTIRAMPIGVFMDSTVFSLLPY
ncbi:type II toxin-antitoxin system Phd/YefM family antitoxin [Pseudomonas aeruginosa]|uniref:type II toxin-antitoxin system Phd/YefM family antitoxin n=1 Tax=Pseudomonas TaxID=286 RepID=UPI0015ECB461